MNSVVRLAIFGLALLLVTPAGSAELVFPPGSRVGLVPPSGYTVSTKFLGFEGGTGKADIFITELAPQSYARLAREFTAEAVRNSGMDVVSREEFALPGGPAVMVSARYELSGVTLRKWALSALAGDIALVVVMEMPEDSIGFFGDSSVRAMLRSVSVRPKRPQEELLSVLPYRLDDLGGFHVMRVTPNGMAALTFGPEDTPLPVEQPYLMIVSQTARPPTEVHQNFARSAFAQFAGPSTRIVSEEAIRIGGEPGYQITGESRDERTGDALMIVVWLRFGLWGYVQMAGFARKDQWDDVLARMRAVRDGFGVR